MSGPRSAPSVSYPVGRCRFGGWLLVLLGGAIAAVLIAAAPPLSMPCRAVLAALLLAWIAWAVLEGARPPRGLLVWQCASSDAAGHWCWRTAPEAADGVALDPVSPQLVLDLQQRALLRLRGPRGVPRWVWVERGRAPADWLALRRALVAHDEPG